jgi:hypothetical protein
VNFLYDMFVEKLGRYLGSACPRGRYDGEPLASMRVIGWPQARSPPYGALAAGRLVFQRLLV